MVKLVVAITGASGVIYGVEFFRALCRFYNERINNVEEIHVIISKAAELVMKKELSEPAKSFIFGTEMLSVAKLWREEQIDAAPASG